MNDETSVKANGFTYHVEQTSKGRYVIVRSLGKQVFNYAYDDPILALEIMQKLTSNVDPTVSANWQQFETEEQFSYGELGPRAKGVFLVVKNL